MAPTLSEGDFSEIGQTPVEVCSETAAFIASTGARCRSVQRMVVRCGLLALDRAPLPTCRSPSFLRSLHGQAGGHADDKVGAGRQ
jgi:hypothetical protein